MYPRNLFVSKNRADTILRESVHKYEASLFSCKIFAFAITLSNCYAKFALILSNEVSDVQFQPLLHLLACINIDMATIVS